MLKKEQESYLADTLGMNIETLKEAFTSDEEVEISYKSGTFLDDDALTGLKSAVKSEGYNEGKVAGVEIKAKELKEKFGYEIEGKDIDKIFEHHGLKILESAKVEPNKKVQDLSKSLETLQNKYEADIGLKDGIITEKENTIKGIKSSNDLMQEIPDGLQGLTNPQFATLAKSKFTFEYNDANIFVAKDKGGNVIKDKLEKPIPVKDVLADYATQNSWFGANGRGGEHTAGKSGFKTMHDVMRHMEENKIKPDSPEGEKLQKQFKENN